MADKSLSACLAEIKANPGKFYVYVLSRQCETPFYVGKGVGDRLSFHGMQAAKGVRGYKCAIIRKIWSHGTEVRYRIDSFYDNPGLALAREIALIAEIGRADLRRGTLANQTDGGDGLNNPSQSLRDKQRVGKLEFYRNPENRMMVAERTKSAMARPDVRAKMLNGVRLARSNPEVNAKIIQASIDARRADPAFGARMSAIKQTHFSDPASRKRQSLAWTDDKRKDASRRRLAVLSDPEKRSAFLDRTKKLNSDPDEALRRSERTALYYKRNPAARILQGTKTLAYFSDPANKAAHAERTRLQQSEKRDVINRCLAMGVVDTPSRRAGIKVWLEFEVMLRSHGGVIAP